MSQFFRFEGPAAPEEPHGNTEKTQHDLKQEFNLRMVF